MKLLPRLEEQLSKHASDSTENFDRIRNAINASKRNKSIGDLFEGQLWSWNNSIDDTGPKIAFTVTTAESVDQIRLWLAYHRAIGVSVFYLFVEGQANSTVSIKMLRNEPGVSIIPNDYELQERHAKSRIWKEHWLSAFFNKPCNHELFVRQSLNMADAIEYARRDGVDWILHIDTDELVYPGGSRSYSLKEILGTVPQDVDLLILPNYESLAETDSIFEPFMEVSLFKRSFSHVQSSEYFKEFDRISRGNPNYFTTYGNGKSAARVQPGLRPNGAHRWYNYDKKPIEWTSQQSSVLHYTYNRFSDIKNRRDRCDCKPTPEDAKKCFILPFDAVAFLESSVKNDDELRKFFISRLVWNNSEEVTELLKKGLFIRLYAPQILMRGLQQALGGGMEIRSKP